MPPARAGYRTRQRVVLAVPEQYGHGPTNAHPLDPPCERLRIDVHVHAHRLQQRVDYSPAPRRSCGTGAGAGTNRPGKALQKVHENRPQDHRRHPIIFTANEDTEFLVSERAGKYQFGEQGRLPSRHRS